jgi:glycosyltransferase involved in cell wall biosynthesis
MAGADVIIHTYHGFGFHPQQFFLMRWLLIGVEWLTRWVTTHFIAVSQANLRKGISLRLFDQQNVTLIPEAVDFRRFHKARFDPRQKIRQLGLDPDRPLIGMVACLKPQKAPLDFIRIARLVHKRYPIASFILIGDGVLRNRVEQAIRRWGLDKNVRLLGWRRDVEEILPCLTLFVLTSQWEGLPLVFLEARLSGLPIVATCVDGATDVIQEGLNGYLLPPGDVEGMAERIIELLENPDRARKMGKAALALPRDFDLRVTVKRQQDLYRGLLQTRLRKVDVRSRERPCAQ